MESSGEEPERQCRTSSGISNNERSFLECEEAPLFCVYNCVRRVIVHEQEGRGTREGKADGND